jgi:hypothetical protein
LSYSTVNSPISKKSRAKAIDAAVTAELVGISDTLTLLFERIDETEFRVEVAAVVSECLSTWIIKVEDKRDCVVGLALGGDVLGIVLPATLIDLVG